MNILKKKLGAGLLSLAMLAGGGLHITSADEITVNSGTGSSGIETNVTGTTSSNATSSAPVKGYVQGNPTGYAVDVEWGDMVFVYDKGNYVTSSGKLVRASEVTNIEMGSTAGQVNRWYGFNGTNNKVTVTNLSTSQVTLAAVATGSQTYSGSVIPSLYKQVLTSADGDALAGVSHEADSGKKWVAMSPITLNNPVLANDGLSFTSTTGTSDSIYLNLTGAPANNLPASSANAGAVASITLTFSQAS